MYRGISGRFLNDTDYTQGSIGYWPTFSSTTTDRNVGLGFAKSMAGKDEPPVCFEIYLSSTNTCPTNIHTANSSQQWSFYPSEQEVLLFPFFAFQVVKIIIIDGIKHIILIELPNQNLMEIKEVVSCSLIYFSKDTKKVEVLNQMVDDISQCTVV